MVLTCPVGNEKVKEGRCIRCGKTFKPAKAKPDPNKLTDFLRTEVCDVHRPMYEALWKKEMM
jgi:hypothetical protein